MMGAKDGGMAVSVTFLATMTASPTQLTEKRICLGSQFECTVQSIMVEKT